MSIRTNIYIYIYTYVYTDARARDRVARERREEHAGHLRTCLLYQATSSLYIRIYSVICDSG